ncbi:MAG: isocitrate lyase/PEP mutase family protein [Sphingomonadales bacterium]
MTARPTIADLIERQGCVAAPGAADPMSARIIDQLGFDAVYVGGNALGLSLAKAQPFVTLTETVDATARLARITRCAIIVDAGAGFGDPAHVYGAVQELAAAGASAVHIDDQPYPKSPAYHRGQGALADVATMAARIQAARRALSADSDVMLIARTDALRVAKSLDDAVARAQACVDAGADAVMVLDLAPQQAGALKDALPGVPLLWIGGVADPVPSFGEIRTAGFAMALYPFNTVAAMAAAVADTWSGFMEGGRVNMSSDMLARMRRETLDIVWMQTFWDIEEDLK